MKNKRFAPFDEEYFPLYKAATRYLFKAINKYDTSFTIEDEKWVCEYSIHFHIKETPGWLYGIWWNPQINEEATRKASRFRKETKEVYYKHRACGHVFAQYEKEIDKFTPYRSQFCEDVVCDEWDPYDAINGSFNVYEMIKFIEKEPYLAYYKHYNETDFNREYVRRDKAKDFYIKNTAWRAEDDTLQEEYKEGCLKRIHEIFEKQLNSGEAYIVDSGENCTPRYHICLRLDGEYEDKSMCGDLELEDLVCGDVIDEEMVRELRDYIRSFQEKAFGLGHCVSDIFGDYVLVYHPSVYWDYKKRWEDDDDGNN